MNWIKSTFCIVRLNVDSDVSFLLFKCILHAFVSIRISQHIAPLPHARSAYDAMFFLAWFCHGSGISWVSENGLISPQGLYTDQSNQLIFNMHSTSLVWSRPTKAKQKNNNSVMHIDRSRRHRSTTLILLSMQSYWFWLSAEPLRLTHN